MKGSLIVAANVKDAAKMRKYNYSITNSTKLLNSVVTRHDSHGCA